MKNMLFVIFCLISFIPLVNADSNRLYFTKSEKGLVYDTDYFDEKIFMHHDDMYPNKSYRDVLDIENGTENECELYFKIVQVEQNDLAKELIDNIEMEIYIDDELIYKGIATGEDIEGDGVNLKNAISLGLFKSNDKKTLVAKTKLSKDYDNKNNTAKSYIDWQFYGKCSGVKGLEEINPDTGDYMSFRVMLLLIVVLLLSFSLTIYFVSKKSEIKLK